MPGGGAGAYQPSRCLQYCGTFPSHQRLYQIIKEDEEGGTEEWGRGVSRKSCRRSHQGFQLGFHLNSTLFPLVALLTSYQMLKKPVAIGFNMSISHFSRLIRLLVRA
jgi:hypothetical protein